MAVHAKFPNSIPVEKFKGDWKPDIHMILTPEDTEPSAMVQDVLYKYSADVSVHADRAERHLLR